MSDGTAGEGGVIHSVELAPLSVQVVFCTINTLTIDIPSLFSINPILTARKSLVDIKITSPCPQLLCMKPISPSTSIPSLYTKETAERLGLRLVPMMRCSENSFACLRPEEARPI